MRHRNEPPDWYMPGVHIDQNIRRDVWNDLTPEVKNILKSNQSDPNNDPNNQNGGKRTKRISVI